MSVRTPEQKIADLQMQLARAKKEARAKRTRALIEIGAMMGEVGTRLAKLDKEQRGQVLNRLSDALDKLGV